MSKRSACIASGNNHHRCAFLFIKIGDWSVGFSPCGPVKMTQNEKLIEDNKRKRKAKVQAQTKTQKEKMTFFSSKS